MNANLIKAGIGALFLMAVGYHRFDAERSRLRENARSAVKEVLEESLGQAAESRYKSRLEVEIEASIEAISLEQSVAIDFWGFEVPWSLPLADHVDGAACILERIRQHAEHSLIQAIPEDWGLRSEFIADQFQSALLEGGLAELQQVPCPSCSKFDALATETACRNLVVSEAGMRELQRAIAQLPEIKTSKATAMRQLNREFDERSRLLPPSIRVDFRQAMTSDQAIRASLADVVTPTALGPIAHKVVDYQPDLVYLEDKLADLTATTRLPQLSQPWSSKHPTRNNCRYNPNNCSTIEVQIPPGQDYLVVIKNARDKIVNHGYLRAGTTGEFEVDNGVYTTFFITGQGWNAAKPVPCTDCGSLYGYFNSGVSITKSTDDRLENHIVTFQMQRVLNGNFTPSSSDLDEIL